MPKRLRLPLAILATLATSAAAGAGELVVTVGGITADTGEIGCALHARAEGFPADGPGAAQQWQPARAGGVSCRFKDLATGTYAVAVSHDLNGNRVTDTSFLGIPREPWGVSNNVRPSMRVPRFTEAAVSVTQGRATTITVEVAQ